MDFKLVLGSGIEPLTPALSWRCSTSELTERDQKCRQSGANNVSVFYVGSSTSLRPRTTKLTVSRATITPWRNTQHKLGSRGWESNPLWISPRGLSLVSDRCLSLRILFAPSSFHRLRNLSPRFFGNRILLPMSFKALRNFAFRFFRPDPLLCRNRNLFLRFSCVPVSS